MTLPVGTVCYNFAARQSYKLTVQDLVDAGTFDIQQLLGDEAGTLLNISQNDPKRQYHVPGPDFIDRTDEFRRTPAGSAPSNPGDHGP